MKRILYSIFFLATATGCSKESDNVAPEPITIQSGTIKPSQVVGQQWKLVKMVWRSQMAGQADTNYPLPYQETLLLQTDSTFIRYRDGVKATGSFSIKNASNPTNWKVVAVFDDPSVAFHTIGNHTQSFAHGMGLWNGKEDYLLQDYSSFDGPTFYHQRVVKE